jgi:hypothetical protein
MWFRPALLLTMLTIAVCSPTEARQEAHAVRGPEADHYACLKSGFRQGSENYVACRKQLARRRAPRSGRHETRERSWWPFPNAIDYGCESRGYKPGTAAFQECRRRSELAEAQRRQQEQQQQQEVGCLRGGSGIITPLGGSTFSVFCSGRTFICPGDINCPVCPGSIGCPPTR